MLRSWSRRAADGSRPGRRGSKPEWRAGRRWRCRGLEFLEDRALLTTWIVDNILDGAVGDLDTHRGSLRFCLTQSVSGDDVQFDSDVFNADSPQVIQILSTLTINKNLTISGPGASIVTLYGFNPISPTYSVFTVSPGVTASLSNLTVWGGYGQTVATPPQPFDQAIGGGGIFNRGTLNVSGCVFTGSQIKTNNANRPALGGGIYNEGTLNVSFSTFAGNTADLGGAIYNNVGTVAVGLSFFGPATVSAGGSNYFPGGNSATDGGAIASYGGENNTSTTTLTTCTLRGNSAAEDGGAIFEFAGTTTVQTGTFLLHNVASGSGGGIANNGTVVVQGSTLAGNIATTSGGALFNNGLLEVSGSWIGPSGAYGANLAGAGAGIHNETGDAKIDTSTITGNIAGLAGGGLSNVNFSSLAITQSTISNNSAPVGGGIGNAGTLTIDGSTLSGNTATTGDGGGINNAAFTSTTITNSLVTGNQATLGGGGGIANGTFGTVKIEASTVSGNTAATLGGGVVNAGFLTLSRSTLNGNAATTGGAVSNSAFLTGLNATIHGNTAQDGAGIDTSGDNANINLTNVTITANTATVGAGGGLHAGTGAPMNLTNTLVAGNFGVSATGRGDIAGALNTNSRNNLIGDGTGATGVVDGKNGNQVGTAASPILARLGPLANNGGLTRTVALLPGSPAIDAGNNLAATLAGLTTDQRGTPFVRIADGGSGRATVDIGAFEVQNLVVTTLDDVVDPLDDKLSLREAVALANLSPTDSTLISFAGTLSGALALSSGLSIQSNVYLKGPGAAKLSLQGGGTANKFSILAIQLGANVNVSGLTLRDGGGTDLLGTTYGGAIRNLGTLTLLDTTITTSSADQGGAIVNAGALNLLNVTLTGNSAGDGGAIQNDGVLNAAGSTFSGNMASNRGGALANAGQATVLASTFAMNQAGSGGALANSGTLVLGASTLSGNQASASGGGIDNAGTLTAYNSTIHGNTAAQNGGGVEQHAGALLLTNVTLTANRAVTGPGGGIHAVGGLATLNNTIVAGNLQGASPSTLPDDAAGVLTTVSQNNLFGTGGSANLNAGNSVGNLFSVADAGLGPLANNGGLTQTVALLATSPAIDAGNVALAVDALGQPLATDQRGKPRTSGNAVDIGAFEVQSYVVNTLTDDNNPNNALVSLREAIAKANGDVSSLITFQPGLTGTIRLSSALPAIASSVSIVGPGASALKVQWAGTFPFNLLFPSNVFTVNAGATASLSGLTITGGRGTNGLLFLFTAGGGIFNRGTLVVNGCVITGNSASRGGGIFNTGTLTLKNSTVSGNTSSGDGGGILNSGTLVVCASTISGNTAGGSGGGISNTGTMTVVNSTLYGNKGANGGGISTGTGAVTLTNTTVTANRTAGNAGSGGGIRVLSGAVLLNNTLVARNFRGTGTTASDVTGTLSTLSASNLFGTGGSGGLNGGNSVGNLFNVANPGLGALASNGGPTQTVALLPGSPAINAGNVALAVGPNGQPLTTDQRGKPRVVDGQVDIGAYEAGA